MKFDHGRFAVKQLFSIRALTSAMICIGLLQFSGCAVVGPNHQYYGYQDGAPSDASTFDVSNIPDPTPRPEPLCKYGNMNSYSVNGETYHVLKNYNGYDQRGIASWYGTKFDGKRTSCGDSYNLYSMTAASTVLPLPTYVHVFNLKNGRQCIVKVNDRGPFHENRIIDLSFAAAKKLGIYPAGTGLVEVKAIDPHNPNDFVAPPPPVLNHPQIYLQIGAFAQVNNANRLAARIQSYTSEPIHIREAEVNNTLIYRVQIGPLASVDRDDELHHELIAEHLGEPMTVIQ